MIFNEDVDFLTDLLDQQIYILNTDKIFEGNVWVVKLAVSKILQIKKRLLAMKVHFDENEKVITDKIRVNKTEIDGISMGKHTQDQMEKRKVFQMKKTTLKKEEAIVNAEKLFRCVKCGFATNDENGLQIHIGRKHGGNINGVNRQRKEETKPKDEQTLKEA